MTLKEVQKSLAVLIIDDDKSDRETIKGYLKSSHRNDDLEIQEAESGFAALEILRKRSFDCVFLDYLMPGMDGIALLNELYDPETDLAGSPFVMVTGKGGEVIMRDALSLGVQDYMRKGDLNAASFNIAIAKAREIFELKRSRNQVALEVHHAHRMEAIGQLSSGVAHDFNNLLTFVQGNTRLLLHRLNKDPDNFSPEYAEKKIRSIEKAADRGANLVRKLMIFSRQNAPSQEITDIGETVEKTFDLLKATLGKIIEIEIIRVDKSWPVSVDVAEFENILINLAVNARDAMSKGGKLTVQTSNVILDEIYTLRYPDVEVGPYVMIEITDTGEGMNPAVIKRIFEPFFTTKEIGQGTGLGLSMVYGFIKQSKGHISVYSWPDNGTVFRIYLPKAEQKSIIVDDLHHRTQYVA